MKSADCHYDFCHHCENLSLNVPAGNPPMRHDAAAEGEVIAGTAIGVDNEFARRYSLPFGMRRSFGSDMRRRRVD